MQDIKLHTPKEIATGVDITIDKDDVLTVLISKQEDALMDKLKEVEEQIDDFKFACKNYLEKIALELFADEDELTPEEKYTAGKCCINWQNTAFQIYDIERLEKYQNPKRASNKKTVVYEKTIGKFNNYKLKQSIGRYFEVDGFEGTLSKEFIAKVTDRVLQLCELYNEQVDRLIACRKDFNEIQWQLILLDTDKSLRAKMIKNLLGIEDMTQLLKEA